MSMKISARTNAPVSVANGENARLEARVKKYETTETKPTKMMRVSRIVVSMVLLSWLRLAINHSTPSGFLALKA